MFVFLCLAYFTRMTISWSIHVAVIGIPSFLFIYLFIFGWVIFYPPSRGGRAEFATGPGAKCSKKRSKSHSAQTCQPKQNLEQLLVSLLSRTHSQSLKIALHRALSIVYTNKITRSLLLLFSGKDISNISEVFLTLKEKTYLRGLQ